MDIMHLRYFQAAAKTQKFTQAAEQMHISQPAFSASLSKLEKELGVHLFDRIGRRIQLNEYGKIYIRYVDQALADELMGSAAETHVSREYLINTLIAYVTVKKNLNLKDCNGFTVPCPDVCSTRRINEMKFTFCMTHSLLMEQGIPSSCEFDVACVLSQQALIAVSHMSPYMGNAYPLVYDNGKLNVRHANDAEVAKLMADPTNLYAVQHSVAHRRMKDPAQNGPFALRHFAFDQKFGAVFRYDWNRDAGQAITLCRFSPDGKKLFVGKGVVVAGGGYEEDNCSGPVFIRVKDQEDFFNKQCEVGMHLPLVYGDFTKELIALAELFGVEAVVA